MDGIELEILWSNLIATVSEQAHALQRIAFSPIVREAGDLATALFDRRGRMVAQAVTGTPGHINSLAAAGIHFVTEFPPDTLSPGDVLITNDPWLTAGHFFDITVMTPVFRAGRCIGFFGSTIHHTDIGGYGVGAGARDVHEEGLWIPLCKLYEAGRPNALLHAIIGRNVRTPEHVAGDLSAQVASGRVGAERLNALCDRHGLVEIEALADQVIARSEEATRASISRRSSAASAVLRCKDRQIRSQPLVTPLTPGPLSGRGLKTGSDGGGGSLSFFSVRADWAGPGARAKP